MDPNLRHTLLLYQTGGILCLSLAVVFLITAVILFFVFRIPKIFTNKTGRAMRKSMKAMEEKNARTSQLRQNLSASLGRRSSGRFGTRKPDVTASLGPEGTAPELVPEPLPIRFEIEKRVMLIHSNERLEL